MSFKDRQDFTLDISKALETAPVDPALAKCIASYTLWVFDESAAAYVPWDSMVVALEEALDRKLYSSLWFDMATGNLGASFNKADVEGVKHLFEYTEGGVDKTAVKFQLRAMIPGSTAQGAATPAADLVTGEFVVRLVAAAEVETCDGNRIDWDGVTFSDKERETYVYNIPKAGEAVVPLDIEALRILTDKPQALCPIEMIAQVMVDGDWHDVRTDSYHQNQMDTADVRFRFELTQKQYINEIISRYGSASMEMSEIPRETTLTYRMVAWDKTDKDGTMIEEVVMLKLVSSGQTAAAACDFTPLSLVDKITNIRKYRVGKDFDGIHISAAIDGKADLADQDCADELYMAIEMDVGGGVVEQVWSQDAYITTGGWISHHFLWVNEDNRIMLDISRD
jgi:hypothetical protein